MTEGGRGYLWQGRFYSVPLDEQYLFACMRYVEMNPVRAGLVNRAEDYPWSSAKAHVFRTPDRVLSFCYLEKVIKNWARYLTGVVEDENARIRTHTRTGRVLGSEEFINQLEQRTGRILTKQKTGPKPKN